MSLCNLNDLRNFMLGGLGLKNFVGQEEQKSGLSCCVPGAGRAVPGLIPARGEPGSDLDTAGPARAAPMQGTSWRGARHPTRLEKKCVGPKMFSLRDQV